MASRERKETDRAPIAEIDRLVHEPARLSILGLLYVEMTKEFVDKRPLTLLRMTRQGRDAFDAYRQRMRQFLDDIPVI